MIPNVDRWSKKVSNFSSVCFQVSLSCQRRLTRNDRSSYWAPLLSVARQLFFFKFSVSKWFFASGKRLINTRDKRNDIYYKFVAENSRVSDRIEEEQLPRVQKLRVQKLIGSEWWTRNMGRSTCFARLWKRIMGSLQIILILHVYNLVT